MCDGADPTDCQYKQGDGDVPRHDWALEETLSAVIMQSEFLLISRDLGAAAFYLPLFNRTLGLIESRRDASTNLFLAGQSSNLLAPSYGAWLQANGTRARAFLTGLSVSYIAALDRVVELETLAGSSAAASVYAGRRAAALQGLPQLLAPTGDYFMKWMDPNGTRHGVLGQPQHGYIEAVVNHDAVALGVAERVKPGLSGTIMSALTGPRVPPNPTNGGPGVRPFSFVLTNAGGLDDMEAPDTSWLWEFGTWVNGGAWATCEARMLLAYARTGHLDLSLQSWRALAGFASIFRMDSPLVAFGSEVYQPGEPINIVYDMFGVASGLLRSLWDPVYKANELTVTPHIPGNFSLLQQHFPMVWGQQALYFSARGDPSAPITSVTVDGGAWPSALFTPTTLTLPWAQLPPAPSNITVVITFGGASPTSNTGPPPPLLPSSPPGWLHPHSSATALRVLKGAVPQGTALWLEADTLVGSLADGARVSQWGDASPSGAHATQANVALQPLFFTNGTGTGAPGVLFDGQGTFLANAASPSTPAHLTVLARFRDDGSTSTCCTGVFVTNGTCLAVPDSNLSTGCAGLSTKPLGGGDTRVVIDWAGSTDLGLSNVGGDLVTGSVVYNGSGGFSWVDGCAQSVMGGGVSRPGEGYMVGSRGAFLDRYLKGLVSAVLVWPRALNDSERGAAEAYLAAKYPRPAAQAPLDCSGIPSNCTLPPPLEHARTHLGGFTAAMRGAAYADSKYELAHALLGSRAIGVWSERCEGLQNKTITPLASVASQRAADALYQSTGANMYGGLNTVISAYAGATDPDKARIYALWVNTTVKRATV